MVLFRKNYAAVDLLSIAGLLLVAGFFAWQVNVFSDQSEEVHRILLEIDEAMAILALGFALLSWSRVRSERREVARRIAAEQRARTLAMEDPLTGLPNRRQFEEALQKAVAGAPSGGGSHAVFMLDLNGFKKVNDVHGHPVGDEVLTEVGSRLREAIREGDLLARLGGDEFTVLASNLVGPEAATGLALRMIDALATPVAGGRVQHAVSAAIGISLIPQDGDGEQAVRKADIALYRAKKEGARRYAFSRKRWTRTSASGTSWSESCAPRS